LDNLLERDALFTELLREQTRVLGMNAVEVDTTTSIEVLTRRVAAQLNLGNDTSPIAR